MGKTSRPEQTLPAEVVSTHLYKHIHEHNSI